MSEDFLENKLKNKDITTVIQADESNEWSCGSSSDDSFEEQMVLVVTSPTKNSNDDEVGKKQNDRKKAISKPNQQIIDKLNSVEEAKEYSTSYLTEDKNITNDLKNLKLEDLAIDGSPLDYLLDKKGGITYRGESSMSLDFAMKRDGLINSKFYPLKSKVCKDDSFSNRHHSNLNVSSFSNYLENNPMLRYFDSPSNPSLAYELLETKGLTRPITVVRTSDNDLKKSKQKTSSQSLPGKPKSKRSFTIKNNFYLNTSIDTSINFNVPNYEPLNNSNLDVSKISSSVNMFLGNSNFLNKTNQRIYNPYDSINNNLNTNEKLCGQLMTPFNEPNNNFTQVNHSSVHPNMGNLYNTNNFPNNFNQNYMVNDPFVNYNSQPHYATHNDQNYFMNNNVTNHQNYLLQQNQMNMMSNYLAGSNNYGNMNNNQPVTNFGNKFFNRPNLPKTSQWDNKAHSNTNSKSYFNNNLNLPFNKRNINNNDTIPSTENKTATSNYTTMSNSEIGKNIYALAKDQNGCRFIQKKLQDEGNDLFPYMCHRIMEHLVDLINDSFGNYLIQKIFQYLTKEQLFQVLGLISPHIESIASNHHGTRVLQHLIDFLPTESLILSFASVLRSSIVSLMKDINASHILFKFFDTIDSRYTRHTYQLINQNLIDISMHKNGCCSIQKCIEIADPIIQREFINNIIHNCLILIVDPFGNYLVQFVLDMKNFEDNKNIIKSFSYDIMYYSKQKYSSNVVEKCFNACDEESKNSLIYSFLNKETITELLYDMFGNYIVQKLLSVTTKEIQYFILITIAPLMENLRLLNFGPRIYDKLILSYPQLSLLMFSANINNIISNEAVSDVQKDKVPKGNSTDYSKGQDFAKDVMNIYKSSRFAKNYENGSPKITTDANFYKQKHKNSN